MLLLSCVDYIYWIILDRKVYYKSYHSCGEKIDWYASIRQIVIKGLGTQIDIERESSIHEISYAGTSFQSIVWILISVIVTK